MSSVNHVHCRTGSLEITTSAAATGTVRSLPHRQLRNMKTNDVKQRRSSLPHRQLRNYHFWYHHVSGCSLPHRQLRKIETAKKN
ncbi:TPA: hypothetical protein I8Z92_001767 [Legionella pneumophila]|nr:hypothetical protein [Legionella pneumophila]